ncbi:lytic transglycosylase domain-containing protein [Paraburkholderia guartelaensis]|uniref:Lytic transglycosylase domain-containing protein n=1 Tax=Paraburkholderia guartelaensis TaxID=2546446 RepID=A0A4R5LER3_9BURK|nr:lytic transglycosylase domain-containing protein [Paraburkholderia guartelaensis]TDG07971.1 lytic transglycosylase domain-containing protein [Paraburkholderia guartelaensis]
MSKRLVRVYRVVGLALTAAALVACSTADAVRPVALPVGAVLSNDDQTFIQLREAARNNDPARAAQLAAMIPDYPAPSYLEYFQLKPQLFDSQGHARIDAPDAPVLSFLQRYDGQAIADRMRNDYLTVLGARHDWANFDQQYSRFVLNDDTQVKCYALESRAARGENVANDARALLVEPRYYGDGCVDLITALAIKGQFSSDDVWQQIRLAYEQNQTSTGAKLLDGLAQRPDPTAFSQAVSAPPLTLAQGVTADPQSHQLALLAVTVMAANDPAMAAATFATVAPQLSSPERAIGWGTIGYQGALKRLPASLGWYRLSANAPLSNPAYEWRTRAALLGGDWTMVRWSIEQMPAALRAQPSWVYWHARALKQAGETGAANQEFASISPGYNFYGQLATEELGQKITIPPKTTVSDAEIAQVAQTPGFALAQRFYALNLRLEGNREWNWPLRGMSDRQLLAVAEYAKRIQLLDRTVNTADRTQTEHDFSLRYLAPFRDVVERDAQTSGLDVEWAYGLIRQESRFILNAKSGVGASGLMQIMPATAQMVAKKIGLGPLSRDQLNDLDTNILLGTNYLSMIYNQFDGSAVLATAGYNAGPGRPRAWRQTLQGGVEGAIFAETIPFQETRDYVKNVLSNTVYYAALFEGRPQSLKARLGYISP